MSAKEYELWDTCAQLKVNCYSTQSSVLTALYDCVRFGSRGDCLDVVLQRPSDKQIYICSPRDEVIQEWFEAMEKLIFKVRLVVETDLIGMYEWMEYSDIQYVTEDRGGSLAVLNMERYAAVVSDKSGIEEGIGATELEALGQALLRLKEKRI